MSEVFPAGVSVVLGRAIMGPGLPKTRINALLTGWLATASAPVPHGPGNEPDCWVTIPLSIPVNLITRCWYLVCSE